LKFIAFVGILLKKTNTKPISFSVFFGLKQLLIVGKVLPLTRFEKIIFSK